MLENTRLVYLEAVITLEFSDKWAVHEHLFLHHLLGGWEIVPSNIITILDSGKSGAVRVVGAFEALGLGSIRCTFLSHQVPVLGQETIEDGPATITTLVQVVTL